MEKLNPGDVIVCCVKNNTIIDPRILLYDALKTFDIIAYDNWGYYLYVPHDLILNNTTKVDNSVIKRLSLDKKYFNDRIIHIDYNFVFKVKFKLDGCLCSICKKFYHQAVSNQEDGTLICWACRNGIL